MDAETRKIPSHEVTYGRLRDMILFGHLEPGQPVTIQGLIRDLDAGMTPVREAIRRLAAEGALVNIPNAGVAVPFLSRAEFDDVLDMRLLLEGEAAERGALRIAPSDAATMERLSDHMDAALQVADAKSYLAANEDFHRVLYRAAGSPALLALIETVWLKVGPLSNQLFANTDALPVLNNAHVEVLRALQLRDNAAVRRCIEQDLFVAGQFLRQSCRGR